MKVAEKEFTSCGVAFELTMVMLSDDPQPSCEVICVAKGLQAFKGLSVGINVTQQATSAILTGSDTELNSTLATRLSSRFGGQFLVSVTLPSIDTAEQRDMVGLDVTRTVIAEVKAMLG